MNEVESLIPHRPPFLFVDTIVARTESTLTARRTWRAEEDFYRGHYPGAPITPGVILCESVFQAGALLLAGKLAGQGTPRGVPLLAKVGNARFRSPVYPGDTITIDVKINEVSGGFYLLSGAVRNGDQRVLNVDFSVAWKTPEGRITTPIT